MASSTQGIQIPIDLQIRNLRDIGDQIKSFASKNLLENAFSSKKINGELDRVGKLLDQISAKSKQAFTSNSDFTSITRDIAALEIEFNKMQDTVTNIHFEDIKVPTEAQGQIEALTNKINELKGSLDNIKQVEMGKLLSNADFIKDFNIANPGKGAKILEKGYDEVEKAIKVGMGRVNTALQIANTEYQNLQANFNANTFGKSSFQRAGALDFLSKAFQKLPSEKEQYNAEQKIMSQFMNTTTDSKGQSSFASFQGGVWGSRGFLQMLQNNYSFSQTEINAIAQRARETAQELNKKVSEVWQQAGQDDTLAKKLLFGDQSSNVTAAAEQYKQQIEAVNAAKANLEEKINQSDAMKRLNTAFEGPSQAVTQQAEALKAALKAPQAELEQLKASVLSSVTAFPMLGQAFSSAAAEINTVTTRIQDGRAKLASLDATINKMQGVSNFINRYIGLYAIVNKVTKAVRDAFNNIRELDKVITDIAVVTNMSQADLWGKISEYTSMAQQYGVATKDVYSVSQIFYQQGLQTSQVMSLTTETLKMAKIAGIDYTDAANAMTVAVRAYNIEMSNAQMVTDVYSALAAKFAVSSAEIANAMEKTASSAASVGMTLQSTSAFISVMEQTTRESAQNIGSALKSIISRYGEMKASPDKLLNIEGEEVAFNKVDTALASIGISIKDASGQFRDFDDVIMELASKWNTLDNNTQRYIATIMAGNRQQSRFIALVSNYGELSRAMSVASNAENTSIVQTAKTLDSLESKTNQLKNAFSQLYLDLHIEDGMKATYDWLTRIVSTIGKLGTGNGALSTLTTLINSGFGAKQLISTISDIYKQKRLNVQGQIDADTSKANSKIDDLIKKAQGPYETQINAKVDSTQVKELETTVDNITNKINNINATAAASSTATATTVPQVQKPVTPDAFQSQLYAAFASGGLNNTAGQQQFLASAGMQADMGQYATISAMLSSFDGSAAAAQELTTAFANATGQVTANTSAIVGNTQQEIEANSQGAASEQGETAANLEAASGAKMLGGAAQEASSQLRLIGGTVPTISAEMQQAIIQWGQSLGLSDSQIQSFLTAANNAASGLNLFTGLTKGQIAALLPVLAQAGVTIDGAAREASGSTQFLGERMQQTGGQVIDLGNGMKVVTQAAQGASTSLDRLSGSANGASNPPSGGGTPVVPPTPTPTPLEQPKVLGEKSWFRNDENGALKFSSRGMTGMMLGTSAVRMLAPLITAAGAAHKDTSKDNIETSKLLTGIGNGLSGAATGASIGMMAGPWGAAIGAVTGFLVQGIGAISDALTVTAAERIAMAEQEAQEAADNSLKEQAKVIDLSSNIDNLKALKAAMYNSEEDMKAYKDAIANMAADYPQLISQYDAAGDAIIEIESAEAALSEARISGARAAEEAALAEINASDQRLRGYNEISQDESSPLEFLKEYRELVAENTNADGSYNLSNMLTQAQLKFSQTGDNQWYNTAEQFLQGLNMENYNPYAGGSYYSALDDLDTWMKENSKTLNGTTIYNAAGVNENTSFENFTQAQLDNLVNYFNNQLSKEQNRNQVLHQNANNAIGNTKFLSLTDADSTLQSAEVEQLESGKNYLRLFNSMLMEKLPSGYTDLYSWQNAEDSDFNEVAGEVYDQLLTWYNSLSDDLKQEFANIDLTAYGREELISKFKLTDDGVKDQFITNFIEANKSNRDRILKTIYGEKDGQQTQNLNDDLKGLAKFSTNKVIDDDGNVVQENNTALDIAYRFFENEDKPSAILSQYADYFTTQLLDINELAENGYTELAQNRLNILGQMSEALAGADSSTQRDLFSTLTKVDFSDYDSLANAAKALETYKTPENAAQVEPILAQLTAAQESLLFNVTSLAQGLVDSVSNAAKDINSLLSANKSGLSFDKALDAFKELNTDLSFDKVFNYDAVLGQYVYTSKGLQKAIADKEGKLEEQVTQLNTTNDLYSKLIYKIVDEESGQEITNVGANLQASDFSSKETLQSAVVSKLAPNADSKVKQIWQNLAAGYIDSLEVGVQGTYQGFEEYIQKIIDSNKENAADAQAVLDEYEANKKNILYQSIDWSKLALGTDFSGNNRNTAVELAKEIGLYVEKEGKWVWKTLDGAEATNEEILDKYLNELYKGQANAGQLIEQAKARIKGQIESARSQQGSKAITEILADQGTKLSEETIAYINQLKGDNLLKDVKVGEDGTLTAEDITKTLDPISTAIEIYQQNVKNSIYTTLAERNKSYGEIITKTFSKANAGKNLLAAGNKLDLSTIESSLTTLGINWDEIYNAAEQTWQGGFENILSTDAFGETTIKDWNAFVTALKNKGLDLTKVTEKEYQKWYRAYLDGQVNDLNDTNEKAAQDALSKLTSAGQGESVNVQALRDAGIDMSVLDPDNNGIYEVIDAYSRDSAILAINTAEITNKTLKDAIEAAQQKILALGNFATATSYATKGASSLSEIDSFKQSYEQLVGESLSDEAFSYDSIQQSFVLDTSYMQKYIKAQKNRLLQMGYTEEFVNQYIKDQTDRIIQDNIALDGFLNATTSTERNDEANKLIQQIRGLSNYKDLFTQDSSLIQKLKDHHFDEESFSRDWEQYQDQYDLLILETLESGGQAAVDLLKQIKPNASADELSSVYSNAINRLNDALADAGEFIKGSMINTTSELYQILKSINPAGVNADGVITATYDMVEVYAKIYAEMSQTAGATTAGLNETYVKLLTAQDQENADITDILSNASGMTYDAFATILTRYGISLQSVLANAENYGVIRTGYGKIAITNFNKFQEKLGQYFNGVIDKTSQEYLEAYSSYVDSQVSSINQSQTNLNSAFDQIKSITEAKAGEALNVAYVEAAFDAKGQKETLTAIATRYGAVLKDGLLQLTDFTDIPGLVNAIGQEAQEAGILIPEQLGELSDAISDMLNQITSLIRNGIEGNLSNAGAAQLQQWATKQKIGDLDFNETADGLKLTAKSMADVYVGMKSIDKFQAQSLLSDIMDTKDSYQSLTGALMEFNDAQKSTNDTLDHTSELLQDVVSKNLTSADSMNFMSNSLPEGMQTAVNAWENASEAINTLTTGQKKGYMGVQDFYNIITTASSLLEAAGQDFSVKGMNAAQLIELAGSNLKVVGGKLQVDLSASGMDITGSIGDLKNQMTDGIQELAKSEIEMLDAEIQVLEVLAAMEKLGDVDVNGNGINFEIGDLFTFDENGNEVFTDEFKNYLGDLQSIVETMPQVEEALKNIKVGAKSLYELVYSDDWNEWKEAGFTKESLSQFLQTLTTTDWDIDNIQSQVADVLSGLKIGISVQLEDGLYVFTVTGKTFTFDWSDEDQMKQAQAALDEFYNGKYKDTQAGIEDLVAQYTTGKNSSGQELSWEERCRINTTLAVASGSITVKKAQNSTYYGYYKNKKITGNTETEVKNKIGEAMSYEDEGYTFTVAENGDIQGELKVGKTSIQITHNGKGETEYHAVNAKNEKYDGTDKNEALGCMAAGGEGEQGIYEFKGQTYSVFVDAATQLTYSVYTDATGTHYVANGHTFDDPKELQDYLLFQQDTKGGLRDTKSEKDFEIVTIGNATITYDLKKHTVEYLYNGTKFASREEYLEYIAAYEKAGGVINANNNVEYTVSGCTIETIVDETGNTSYRVSFMANGKLAQFTAEDEAGLKAGIAAATAITGEKTIDGASLGSAKFTIEGAEFTVTMGENGELTSEDATGDIQKKLQAYNDQLQKQVDQNGPLELQASSINVTLADGGTVQVGSIESPTIPEMTVNVTTLHVNPQNVDTGSEIPTTAQPVDTSEAETQSEAGGEKVGEGVGDGAIKGMQQKEGAVKAKGESLGKSAVDGTKIGSAVASPSKLTIEVGNYIGEGLIKGLSDKQSLIVTAGTTIGTAVITAINTAVTEGMTTLSEGIAEAVESVDKSYTELETKTEQVAGSIRSHWEALVNQITTAVSLIQSLVQSLQEKISITWTIGSEGGTSDSAGFGSGQGIDPNREMTALTEYMDKMLSTMEHNKENDTFKVTMPALTIDTSKTEINIDDIGTKIQEEATKNPVESLTIPVGAVTVDLAGASVNIGENSVSTDENSQVTLENVKGVVGTLGDELDMTLLPQDLGEQSVKEGTKITISNPINAVVGKLNLEFSDASEITVPDDAEKPEIDIDVKPAEDKITELQEQIDGIKQDDELPKINVDITEANTNLTTIQTLITDIANAVAALTISIPTDFITLFTSLTLNNINATLDHIIEKKTIPIKISLDAKNVLSELGKILQKLTEIQEKANISINGEVNGKTPEGGETPKEGETSQENQPTTTTTEVSQQTKVTTPGGTEIEMNAKVTATEVDGSQAPPIEMPAEAESVSAGGNIDPVSVPAEAESVDVPSGTTVAIQASIDVGEAGQSLSLTATYTVTTTGDIPADKPNLKATYTGVNGGGYIPGDMTATVTWNGKKGSGYFPSGDGGGGAAGNFGLASGTLSRITGPAHARSTLMGELGPELVVSNGRYFVAGQNGAEMVDLDEDAIVFNHLQTEQLLKNGMSKERGRAVTNERNAVAFAKGNIGGGPAMASASAALAVLKQIRSMWQSLLSATAKDLAGAGGSGGGGGGGKDKGGKGSDAGRKSFIEDVERWYNLMQEIAKLEKVINHEETLRAKLEGDLHKNGSAYYKSQKESLSAIQKEIKAQEELNISRREYFNQRRKQLNEDNGPFNQLYEFDEQGQLKYKSKTEIKGSKATNGYAFLADLMAQDPNTGKPKYTVEQQYKILKKAGFAKYMKYDSSGNEIKLGGTDSDEGPSEDDYNTYYSSMVQAFWDRVEAQKSEMQTLYDSVAEGENNLLEIEQQRNELLEAMYDNQKELENSVLNAIEDMKQREIDALQDERDKLEEATGKYIEGLSDALDKERQMYDTQENQNELDTKKRRLGILQRSGASAEDIYSLQKEITESEKNMYFDAQQAQIDAIQQASDLEIERLDTQIQIMQDTLDFQKEMGLLWYQVYEVMGKSGAEITSFVTGNDSSFWAKSPLEQAQTYEKTLFEADQWKSFAKDTQDFIQWTRDSQTADALSTYSDTMSKQHDKDDFWKNNKERYEGKFTEEFEKTGDRTKAATEASKLFETDKSWYDREKAAGNKFIGTEEKDYEAIDDTYHWVLTYKKEVYGGLNTQYQNKGEQLYFESKKKEEHKWENGECKYCHRKKPKKKKSSSGGGWSPSNCSDNCSGVCKGQLSGGSGCSKNCANECRGGCKTGCQHTCTGGADMKSGAAGINNHPSLAKGNRTLIGELGPELIVSNGQYKVAGRNGAEFVNLPDDAIVFNHMQTRSLLRNGRTGRGKSVVSDARSIASSNTNKVTVLKNNADPFSQLYEYDSQGRLKYKSNTKIQGSNLTSAYAFLADLMSSDAKGNSKYSAKQQYEILKKAGFEKYMKYDSSGNEIKLGGTGSKNDQNTYYRSMVQAFWDSANARKSDMSALYASVAESEKALQKLELERDKILQEMQSSGNIIIENASVNMNVQKIANDYDAKRAGEQALNEMLRIANKTSAANNIRR